jgi:hypothetical protein
MATNGTSTAAKHKLLDSNQSSDHGTTTNNTSGNHAAQERFSGVSAEAKCSFCTQEGAKKHCTPCKSDTRRVIYCNAKCQKQHWKEHKQVCLSIAQNKEANPPQGQSTQSPSRFTPITRNDISAPDKNDRIGSTVINTDSSFSPHTNEYVVKFSFKSKCAKQTRLHIARSHYECLQALISTRAEALDNNGVSMKGSFSLSSMSDYEQHFQLYFSPGNQGKKHGPLYTIYHRIRSTMSLGAICKQSKVSTILNKHNVSINLHIWKEDEVDIVNLGFHVAADPYNQLKTHFEAAIRRQITTMTGTQLDKIPYFQAGYSRPFHNDKTGRSVTQTYNLQCRRADAKDLIDLLHATFQHDHLKFAFYKLRHDNPTAYKEAIEAQNEFLKNSRAIPIHGITEELMSYIDEDLYHLHGIYSIQQHKNTATTGRWNLMTNSNNFRSLIPQVQQLLQELVLIESAKNLSDSSFPPIGLAFHKQTRKMTFKPNQPSCASISKSQKQESSPTFQDKPRQTSNPAESVSNKHPHSVSSFTGARASSPDNQYSIVHPDSESTQNTSSITGLNATSPKQVKQSTNNSISNTIQTDASSITSVSTSTQAELKKALQSQIQLKRQIDMLTQQIDSRQNQAKSQTSASSHPKPQQILAHHGCNNPPNSASTTRVRGPDPVKPSKVALVFNSLQSPSHITNLQANSSDNLKHSKGDSDSNESSVTSVTVHSQAD